MKYSDINYSEWAKSLSSVQQTIDAIPMTNPESVFIVSNKPRNSKQITELKPSHELEQHKQN